MSLSTDSRDHYRLGDDCRIDEHVTLGYVHEANAAPTVIGDRARIREGTVLYADVLVGDDFTTGHGALVREETTVGDDVVVGTNTVVDGQSVIGSHVRFQTGVYVPTDTVVGDRVFLGPHATLTNDPYPVREDVDLKGPTLEDDVSIGANATILPDVTVEEGAFVAAGAVVTEDVPARTMALGAPADVYPLPDQLQGGNAFE